VIDYFENQGDPNPPLSGIELQTLKISTDRLFTTLTNKSTKRPEQIIYSLNDEGERQARYTIPFLIIDNQFIYTDMVITQKTMLDNGNPVFSSTIEIDAMSADEYLYGNTKYNQHRQFTPHSAYWIEDCEGFHPVSMISQFYFNGFHYKFGFNNQGENILLETDDRTLLGSPGIIETPRRCVVGCTDTTELQFIMEMLDEAIKADGEHSNFSALANQRVDIPMTNYFAMRDIGYRVTSEGAIIPLLVYR
jgi:hypothetical protein